MTLEELAFDLVKEDRTEFPYLTNQEKQALVAAWIEERIREEDAIEVFNQVPKMKPLIADLFGSDGDLFQFRETVYRSAFKEYGSDIREFLRDRWSAKEVSNGA